MKIAMGQMAVRPGCPGENQRRAVEMIGQAAAEGCSFVVLPECLDFGWTDGRAREGAEPIPGLFTQVLSEAASDHGIHVVAGLVERSGDRLFNAAVLIDPDGTIVARHRKINELEIARSLYAVGEGAPVVETRHGRVGINICADNFTESLEIGHGQGRRGAKLLLSPCAWAVDADHDNTKQPYGAFWRGPYRTLAMEYRMTVVGVSYVGPIEQGPWAGRKCIGCSLAVGADGRDRAQGPYGREALCVFEPYFE